MNIIPSVQDYNSNKDIEFALESLERTIAEMVRNRDFGHHLSPQKERINYEIELLRMAIKKIRTDYFTQE